MRFPRRDTTSASKLSSVGAEPVSRDRRQARSRDTLLGLQRRYGNRRARGIIQAKLKVGPADDRYEREADRIANLAMAGRPAAGHGPETIQHVHATAGTAADPVVAQAVQRAAGSGGQAVPSGIRDRMERASGADFSDVRVHVDAESDRLNDALGSRAFTVGADVFVRRGDYRPGSTRGDALLGHELTHTIQQGAAEGTTAPLVQRRVTVRGANCPDPVAFVRIDRAGALLSDMGRRVLNLAKNGNAVLIAADSATDLVLRAERIASMANLIDSVLRNGILGRRTLNQRKIGYTGSNDAAADQTPLAVNVLDARGAQPNLAGLVAESLTVESRGSFSVAMERPIADDMVQDQIQQQFDLLAANGVSQQFVNNYARANNVPAALARTAAERAFKDQFIGQVLNRNRAVFDERVQNTVMAVVPRPSKQIANLAAGNQTYESSVDADQLPPGVGPNGFTELLVPRWFQPYATVLRTPPQGVTLIYVGDANVTAQYRVNADATNWDVTTTAPDYAAALRPLLQRYGHIATHIVTGPTA